MPKAVTNIKVNGRWYDAGDDVDDLTDEELDDLTASGAFGDVEGEESAEASTKEAEADDDTEEVQEP